MTTNIDTAPLGCREPSTGASVSRLLGRPVPPPLADHLAQCLACQLERLAFERFERGESTDSPRPS